MKKRDEIDRAVLRTFHKLQLGYDSFRVDIETPWDFMPPGLYPTIHIEGTKKEEMITIKIYRSI